MYLAAGCVMGLVLGIVPGIGGLAGTAMLLPFTFDMDPYSAFALLLGLGSTTATGDPIPAVLFGVPGGAASAATVLDGFPMAKKGEAGRALSACLHVVDDGRHLRRVPARRIDSDPASGDAVPRLAGASRVLGPRHIDGRHPVGQCAAAWHGRRLPRHHARDDRHRSAVRNAALDFDSLYLWDGLPLMPLLLGVFALPELCDLLISPHAIAARRSPRPTSIKASGRA